MKPLELEPNHPLTDSAGRVYAPMAGTFSLRRTPKQPEGMHDRNDTIWTVMIEKAVVHKGGQITFVFQNGTEIKVGT